MPDWLLTIPRLVLWPILWLGRQIRRRMLNRQALVREGSEIVTPIIHLAKSLGPPSMLFGTDEENRAYLNERQAKWAELRDRGGWLTRL